MEVVISIGFPWEAWSLSITSYLDGFWAKTTDLLHHMTLPMICYMAGDFAVLTILMKNSLLEEMEKDYLRTAVMKGSGK